MIQINEKHISPHATEAQAHEFIAGLAARGWEVTYTAASAVWQFESVRRMWAFERDFEEALTSPAYVWRVTFPCECCIDRPCCGDQGLLTETVQETAFFDYDAPGRDTVRWQS
jgi:hypothetical protein